MSNSSSDDDDCLDSKQRYTEEQKIVAAVWMHERPFNYQTIDDIRKNFFIRFRTEAPLRSTLAIWEKRLFSSGAIVKERKQRPLARLIHVPYVKASLKEKPGLSLTERACQMGLSKNILRKILKYDIKESDLNPREETSSHVEQGEIHIKDDVNSD